MAQSSNRLSKILQHTQPIPSSDAISTSPTTKRKIIYRQYDIENLANLGTLKGKTIFITGASRGIGLAIALRCARDNCNIVIAAKTAIFHPKLPGMNTIKFPNPCIKPTVHASFTIHQTSQTNDRHNLYSS